MFRADGNPFIVSFIVIAQMQGRGMVSSKPSEDYLCGTLLRLVVALCIIIIGTCASENGWKNESGLSIA